MRPEDLHPLIDAAAPFVVAAGCFVMFLRAFKEALPFSIPWRFFGWLTAIVIGGYAVIMLAGTSSGGFGGGLLGIGLVIYIVRWRLASAKTREQQAERLRQARGHERRRAQPPLPPGGPGGTP